MLKVDESIFSLGTVVIGLSFLPDAVVFIGFLGVIVLSLRPR